VSDPRAVAGAATAATPAAAAAVTRVMSLDALRGLVMFLMLAEMMRLWTVSAAFPGSQFWALVAYHTTHVPWQGCSLHDLIQPAFSLLVGAALPFSIASRAVRGQGFQRLLGHAIWRSLALIFLGILLRSIGRPQIYWTFEDTLTQIGLGYTALFLLAFVSLRIQIATFVLLLVGFWAAFVLYPLPAPDFDYSRVGVKPGWPHLYSGFLAHFNKNSNLSWAFDVWFLNLFPRQSPFRFNSGGWSTLSFVPTLATMLIGLWVGRWLQGSVAPATGGHAATPGARRSPMETWKGLLAGGVALTLGGLLFQWAGLSPIVKRIWTSSYTLYSGGLVCLMLAALYFIIDVKGWKRWTFPLLVIGANSIVVYVMSGTIEHAVAEGLERTIGVAPFMLFGAPFVPVLRGAAVLAIFWLVLYGMYRRRWFVRI
jgi:heparan-alpha-glucosaminide N-acetyltransferase